MVGRVIAWTAVWATGLMSSGVNGPVASSQTVSGERLTIWLMDFGGMSCRSSASTLASSPPRASSWVYASSWIGSGAVSCSRRGVEPAQHADVPQHESRLALAVLDRERRVAPRRWLVAQDALRSLAQHGRLDGGSRPSPTGARSPAS